MRFRRNLKVEFGLNQLDVVPFINVIFLLLVFAIFSSSFLFQANIKIGLPKTITSETIKDENLTIVINSEDVMYLNGSVMPLKELKLELAKKSAKERSILIKADRRASLARVVDIWNLCRNIGIEKISITTN